MTEASEDEGPQLEKLLHASWMQWNSIDRTESSPTGLSYTLLENSLFQGLLFVWERYLLNVIAVKAIARSQLETSFYHRSKR